MNQLFNKAPVNPPPPPSLRDRILGSRSPPPPPPPPLRLRDRIVNRIVPPPPPSPYIVFDRRRGIIFNRHIDVTNGLSCTRRRRSS
ncbi:unnamed protein product [Rotaria sp. Silwood1]|nr:unnamed protein product [Rotaria sp. Silwood1]CAF3838672.1 unnamed protein product [Rotaria sp. Silwood1]